MCEAFPKWEKLLTVPKHWQIFPSKKCLLNKKQFVKAVCWNESLKSLQDFPIFAIAEMNAKSRNLNMQYLNEFAI